MDIIILISGIIKAVYDLYLIFKDIKIKKTKNKRKRKVEKWGFVMYNNKKSECLKKHSPFIYNPDKRILLFSNSFTPFCLYS